MTRTQQRLLLAAALAAGLGGSYLVYDGVAAWQRNLVVAKSDIPSADAGSKVLAAVLPDLEDRPQPLAQWRGKVMVLNFWATWCPPCRTEIPVFVKVQEKYRDRGLIIVGVAIDQKDKVAAFAGETGINYPLLWGETEAIALATTAGNRLGGLPFTAVLDRSGNIVATELGGLSETRLEQIIRPLL